MYCKVIETEEEKQERMFEELAWELFKTAKHRNLTLRYACIEYKCHFYNWINPAEMGARLTAEGVNILYDDTSIKAEENARKHNAVDYYLCKMNNEPPKKFVKNAYCKKQFNAI